MLPGVALDFIRRRGANSLLLALLAAAAVLLAVPAAQGATPKPANVSVMTRNLYLGADLTPGVQAASLQGLVTAAGVILKQVDENNFPVRAKGLAAEILKNPTSSGCRRWRSGAPSRAPRARSRRRRPRSATTTSSCCSTQLNKGKKLYRDGDLPARVRLRGLRRTPTATSRPRRRAARWAARSTAG